MPVSESKFGHVRLEPENNEGMKAFLAGKKVGSANGWGNVAVREFLKRNAKTVAAGKRQLQQKGNHARSDQTTERQT